MSRLILRIPDSKYKLFDAKTRFDVMVSKADRARGLELLDKLDKNL
jgi:hypothetical protein